MERVCGKNGGTNPKMAERRGGTLGAERGKKKKKRMVELNQLGRENRKVKKRKVRSKHKFKSFKWRQAEMSTSHFFLKALAGGEGGRAFPNCS